VVVMAGPPQMQTLARKRQLDQQVEEPQREQAPAPNILHRQPVAQAMMPTPEQMSDDELDLYVKRLTMRHKRLSRKWWGLRRKHGKDQCPYCGMNTGGGFCKIHQRDYDEYLGALSTRQNRSFGL
jgi:hypothetical protein